MLFCKYRAAPSFSFVQHTLCSYQLFMFCNRLLVSIPFDSVYDQFSASSINNASSMASGCIAPYITGSSKRIQTILIWGLFFVVAQLGISII